MYHFQLKPFRGNSWMSHTDWDKDLEKFFDLPKSEYFTPACEILDEEKHFLISMDIPGLNKEELDIEVKDNQLLISGERKFIKSDKRDNVLRSEKRYGKFSRTFTLPKNTNPDLIEARFENGVLEIVLPKEEKATSKKIVISDWSRKDTETDLKS